MPTSPLTPQQLREISQAIEQTMLQLQSMEASTDIQPMQYNARLCWEQLYESRELLRAHLMSTNASQVHGEHSGTVND